MIEFPSNVVPQDENKAARERRVFQTFAAYASQHFGPLVIPRTITSRDPPAPDILCEVDGSGQIAYELAEILDEEAQKAISTMMSARQALIAHRWVMSIEDQIRFDERLAARQVTVSFRRDKPLRVLESVVPAFYKWFLSVAARDLCGDSVPIPRELQDAIEYVSILSPGPPLIDITFGVGIADATLSRAARKLSLPIYESSAPVELLLYSHDQALIFDASLRSALHSEIVPLVDASIARGHIRRIWVFSVPERLSDKAIKFVYPPWSEGRYEH